MFTAAGKSAAASSAVYIEDVFSTWLYTGNGSTQTITNGIDLSGKGGMVWLKRRDTVADNLLLDTVRGGSQLLFSNLTSASTGTSLGWSFNSNGFNFTSSSASTNASGGIYASWTFREQAKFFDVVTFTKNASTNQRISHNLGATPGCIMVKSTDAVGNWTVWHRSLASATDSYMILNSTGAASATANAWGSTGPTSTDFGVSSDQFTNGINYVAYLFAHDAGGFGASGSDNVITCGSVVGAGAGTSVSLGYEPQWILMKNRTSAQDWWLVDNMRGLPAPSANAQMLIPNKTDAEAALSVNINATGFTTAAFSTGETYIYIAIRRGLMKTPTSGTSVYENTAYTGNGAADRQIGTAVLLDALLLSNPSANSSGWSSYAHYVFDRLRGKDVSLPTTLTSAEITGWNTYLDFDENAGWETGSGSSNYLNNGGSTYVSHVFRRASGFFDVVCYTGTGAATTFNHNLAVVPELMIVKSRNNATNWAVYCAYLGGTNPANRYVLLNSSNSFGGTSVYWNDTAPTSTVFTVGTTAATNTSAYTYVNYLFATCPGVSKVGSYTGTGALQTVNCGFASGARFVLIKRTDSTGDWYLYNSASGITSGNDPYVLLNSAAAEVTGTNYVDTASTGFQVTAAAPAGLNANGGTYIFLAIA